MEAAKAAYDQEKEAIAQARKETADQNSQNYQNCLDECAEADIPILSGLCEYGCWQRDAMAAAALATWYSIAMSLARSSYNNAKNQCDMDYYYCVRDIYM